MAYSRVMVLLIRNAPVSVAVSPGMVPTFGRLMKLPGLSSSPVPTANPATVPAKSSGLAPATGLKPSGAPA
jgi:hypothetical protein